MNETISFFSIKFNIRISLSFNTSVCTLSIASWWYCTYCTVFVCAVNSIQILSGNIFTTYTYVCCCFSHVLSIDFRSSALISVLSVSRYKYTHIVIILKCNLSNTNHILAFNELAQHSYLFKAAVETECVLVCCSAASLSVES